MNARTPVLASLALVALSCGPRETTEPVTSSATSAQAPPAVAAESGTASPENASNSDEDAIRNRVEAFGERLSSVSLLAPREQLLSAIRSQYEPYVTPDLLESWTSSPGSAPGRMVSSPWPDHIEVLKVRRKEDGVFEVFGDVVEATSDESDVRRVPVAIGIRRDDGEWRIDSWGFSQSYPLGTTAPTEGAVAVLVSYYAAIRDGNYERAYRMWGSNGEASGQTLAGFRSGFADTRSVDVTTSRPGRIEGAAGSRYIEIPVLITAVSTDGSTTRFRGTYTLRHTVIEGSTRDQSRWHIASANIAAVP